MKSPAGICILLRSGCHLRSMVTKSCCFSLPWGWRGSWWVSPAPGPPSTSAFSCLSASLREAVGLPSCRLAAPLWLCSARGAILPHGCFRGHLAPAPKGLGSIPCLHTGMLGLSARRDPPVKGSYTLLCLFLWFSIIVSWGGGEWTDSHPTPFLDHCVILFFLHKLCIVRWVLPRFSNQ